MAFIQPTKEAIELVTNDPTWAARRLMANDVRILQLEKALMTAITLANDPRTTAMKRTSIIMKLHDIRTKGKLRV